MATPTGSDAGDDTGLVPGKQKPKWYEVRFRCSAQMRAAMRREAVSENMSLAAFARACVTRVMRARGH